MTSLNKFAHEELSKYEADLDKAGKANLNKFAHEELSKYEADLDEAGIANLNKALRSTRRDKRNLIRLRF